MRTPKQVLTDLNILQYPYYEPEDLFEAMDVYAKEVLEQAAKKAEVCIKFNDRDNSVLITDEHGLRDQDGTWCEISVHTQSILDSFKPENIK